MSPPSNPCVRPSLEPAPALQVASASAQPGQPATRAAGQKKTEQWTAGLVSRLDCRPTFCQGPSASQLCSTLQAPRPQIPCHLDDCRVPDGGTTHTLPPWNHSWDCFLSSHPSARLRLSIHDRVHCPTVVPCSPSPSTPAVDTRTAVHSSCPSLLATLSDTNQPHLLGCCLLRQDSLVVLVSPEPLLFATSAPC